MIKKAQKKRIKRIIGHRYVVLIQKELNEKNQFNKQGLPYSSSQITNVMNGKPHLIIENAIFSVVQKIIVEQEKIKVQRKAILK